MTSQEHGKTVIETDEVAIVGGPGSDAGDGAVKVPGSKSNGPLRKKRIIVLAVSLAALAVLALFVFWPFEGGEAGRPVPAPRTSSLGETGTSTSSGETTIEVPPEAAERAGIKIETVGEQLAAEQGAASTTGVVQANAYRETPVISLVGGIVRRVSAELGEEVGRGQTLTVISSEELSQTESRFLTLSKEVEAARKNYDRQGKLVRISPVSNAELDQAATRLATAQAELDEHHKHHARTARLLEIGAASREEFEQATTKLKAAEAELAEARRRYSRAAELAKLNPVSSSAFEEAAVKLRTSESELAASRERLRILGLSEERVNALRSPAQISTELPVVAPASGTVTSRTVNAGEVVEANKEVMRVTDLSSVWVIAQVYEKDLGRIRTGTGATVVSGAYPQEVFRGHVTYIDPNINQESRTAQVRVELPNPRRLLKIGMYVNAAFGSSGGAERTVPIVPASAVQNLNNQQVVFVPTDQPNVFALRPVRLASEQEGGYPVIEGLTVGDRVVTEGSFLLRAEWLKRRTGG